MRILTFTSLFPNALTPNLGIFVLQRISQLAQRPGNQVEVIAPVPYAPEFLRGTSRGSLVSVPRQETIENLRVHHPRYPLIPRVSMPLHGLMMYRGCLGLARRLHKERPFDCIDAHYVFPDGLAAVLIGRSLGIPVAVTARGSDIHTFPKFATIRPQIRWTLRQAAGVAAVCDSLAQTMLELERSIERVDVLENGVDSQRFYEEDRLAARHRLGLKADEKIVLSVAGLTRVKGPDLLVRATSLLKKSTRGCRVLFVGKGPEMATLQSLASQLDCVDVCNFVGSVPNQELRHYYSAANVSCLPSRREGWPNVILESLACGRPVVGTDVGAVREILSRPELGIVVEPTPESIHAGLVRALGRQWDKDLLVNYARERTWGTVAARVELFLKRTVDSAVCSDAPIMTRSEEGRNPTASSVSWHQNVE